VAARLTSVTEIEQELQRLRCEEEQGPVLRTSVMTHTAWVPPEWVEAARETLAGLAERHPSRTIVLLPEPEAEEAAIEAGVELQRFSVGEQSVCSEVVRLRLRGATSRVPASVVEPLLVADLPVFLRWRGEPEFGGSALEQLVDVADRVIVDSTEWPTVPDAYRSLLPYLGRTVWSDIAWARTLPWRRALASLWPAVATVRELRVAGPMAEARLLVGWLRACLSRQITLAHLEAGSLERVLVDGREVQRPAEDPSSPSDLLSDELDRFSRDPLYEQAVTRAVTAT
jgi:glucose-6-phosphate dehydrogenase assembly protein OpcA